MFHPSSLGTFPRKYRLLGLLLALLIACGAAFTLGGRVYAQPTEPLPAPPPTPVSGANSAMSYANGNWDCVDPSCSSKVQPGSAQNQEECAEFIARALATEGVLPGLTTNSPQSDFDPYIGPDGNSYDLLWVGYAAPFDGLKQYLLNNGYATDIGNDPADASVGDPVIYSGAGGQGHAAILVIMNGSASEVDQHNVAEHDINYDEYSYTHILHMTFKGANACPEQLQVGSTGTWVRVLQRALNAFKENNGFSTASPDGWSYPLTIDGQFQGQTEAAVVDFQYSVWANLGNGGAGIVGDRTWSILGFCEDYVPSEGPIPDYTGNTTEADCPDLVSQGDSSIWVSAMEMRLDNTYYWGWMPNSPDLFGPYLSADGTFTSSTQNAVVDYQYMVGLGASGGGQVGARTWAELGLCFDHTL